MGYAAKELFIDQDGPQHYLHAAQLQQHSMLPATACVSAAPALLLQSMRICSAILNLLLVLLSLFLGAG
jgi:hypothetical protein